MNGEQRKPSRLNHGVADPARTERLPPHSQEAEQGVLGCILLEPATVIPLLVERIGEFGEAFYDLRHRTIYETVVGLWGFGVSIDMISLAQALRDSRQLDSVGGLAYLSSLPDGVPSAANLEHYIKLLEDKHDCRKLIALCTETVGKVFEEEGEISTHIDAFECSALSVRRRMVNTIKDSKAQAKVAIEKLEAAVSAAQTGAIFGITTGFKDLDDETGGIIPGEYWVIAAAPSGGKTSFAMNIAENIAQSKSEPVGVFSMEMLADQLAIRRACSLSQVNLKTARTGKDDAGNVISVGDLEKLGNAVAKMSSAKLYIDDSSGLTVFQLRAKARRMVQQYGVRTFIVDYLQLLSSGLSGAPNAYRDTSFISTQLKGMAKELNAAVIVLSQVGRDAQREGRKLTVHDLRNSGQIEADADTVLLLNADPEEIEANPSFYPVECEIGKQRNGRRFVTIPLMFKASSCKFVQGSKSGSTV